MSRFVKRRGNFLVMNTWLNDNNFQKKGMKRSVPLSLSWNIIESQFNFTERGVLTLNWRDFLPGRFPITLVGESWIGRKVGVWIQGLVIPSGRSVSPSPIKTWISMTLTRGIRYLVILVRLMRVELWIRIGWYKEDVVSKNRSITTSLAPKSNPPLLNHTRKHNSHNLQLFIKISEIRRN